MSLCNLEVFSGRLPKNRRGGESWGMFRVVLDYFLGVCPRTGATGSTSWGSVRVILEHLLAASATVAGSSLRVQYKIASVGERSTIGPS